MNISEIIGYLNIAEERKKEIIKIISEDKIFSGKEEIVLYILDIQKRSFTLKELKIFLHLLKYATIKKMQNYRPSSKEEEKDLQESIDFLEKNL